MTVSDELRRANDKNRHWVPLLVVCFLVMVAYVWTDWMARYPPPGVEALKELPIIQRAFSNDQLKANVWMFRPSEMASQQQRRVLLLLAGIGFLLAYYLPLAFKKQPLVLLTLLGGTWVLGPVPMALFLAWHLFAYINFHAPAPGDRRATTCLAVVTVCAWLPTIGDSWRGLVELVLKAGLTLPLALFAYRRVYHPVLRSRARRAIHLCTAHSCLIFLAASLGWNVWTGDENAALRPLGWLLFFWQWERVVMYQCDLVDGRVPEDLKVSEYLATFFSPAAFCNFHWLSRIPLGYAYLSNAFLARDKNRIVLSGVWLITLSVVFFCFRPIFLGAFQAGMEVLGAPPRTSYGGLIRAMQTGIRPGALSVWGVLLYEFFNFYLLWTAVAHLKVGLWRLFGYDIEPYFQKPFLATNLVELWKRYSYYYKEFLVRAFYYPVFLRFFKSTPRLRVFVATMAAAGFGNLLYHLVYTGLFYGATTEVFGARLMTLPYYVILGGAIALTQVYLIERGRRRRRPWQWGPKIGLDVLAVIGTIGVFVLVRPFHHAPKHYSWAETGQVVLAAFGIQG
jgi:hypothetical protein